MSTLEQLEILSRMDKMIRLRSTGTPQEFAFSLGISLRSLYNYISLIRAIGAPVYYSRSYAGYTYLEEGSLIIAFHPE